MILHSSIGRSTLRPYHFSLLRCDQYHAFLNLAAFGLIDRFEKCKEKLSIKRFELFVMLEQEQEQTEFLIFYEVRLQSGLAWVESVLRNLHLLTGI